MKKYGVAALLLLLTLSYSKADFFTPRHSCSKPIKPYQFQSEWQYQSFVDDVTRYRRCIESFVQEQRDAAQRHLKAADAAVDEWNRFVRFELN